MIEPLHRPHLAGVVGAGHGHSLGGGDVLELDSQSVAARRPFDDLGRPVQLGEPRSGNQVDRDLRMLQRARQQRDDRRSSRVVLGVGRVGYPEEVAGMLYQNMLESSSRPDEGNSSLPRRAYDFVSRIGIPVRAARPDDHRHPWPTKSR